MCRRGDFTDLWLSRKDDLQSKLKMPDKLPGVQKIDRNCFKFKFLIDFLHLLCKIFTLIMQEALHAHFDESGIVEKISSWKVKNSIVLLVANQSFLRYQTISVT